MRLMMSGGGTGGHVYPILSVWEALASLSAERGVSVDGLYVGHESGVEKGLARRAGLPFAGIAAAQVRGRMPWQWPQSAWAMARGYRQARQLVASWRPDVCLVTGGWVTVPVVLAARTAKVPVLIYLPDVEPGLAIRVLHRWASRVAVTVPEATSHFGDKAVVTGYPVRRAVVEADRNAARAHFGLPQETPVLLVFGGSRGARSINRAVVSGLEALLRLAYVVHITGPLDYEWVRSAREALPAERKRRYHVFKYLHEEMGLALAAADLVVSRAGASVLGEFPARGLPAVLVPYPYAGAHQARNAQYLVRHGAAVMVPDAQLGQRLVPTVRSLLADRERLAAMAAAARSLFHGNGARRIAEELLQLTGAA